MAQRAMRGAAPQEVARPAGVIDAEGEDANGDEHTVKPGVDPHFEDARQGQDSYPSDAFNESQRREPRRAGVC